MLCGDYFDYWMKEYFEINYKYSTSKRYKKSFSNIKKESQNTYMIRKYQLIFMAIYIKAI